MATGNAESRMAPRFPLKERGHSCPPYHATLADRNAGPPMGASMLLSRPKQIPARAAPNRADFSFLKPAKPAY